jgi:hypothetical protein
LRIGSQLLKNLIPQDADRFQKVAAGFQSVVVAFGLILGGLYAASTFVALRSLERSKAELQDLERKLHHTELDLRVDATQESDVEQAGHYIRITVSVENKGNNAVKLMFADKPPIRAALVSFATDIDGPAKAFGPEIQARFFAGPSADEILLEQDILPTENYRYNALLRVREPGIYFVVFEALVSMIDAVGTVHSGERWLASTYVTVRK